MGPTAQLGPLRAEGTQMGVPYRSAPLNGGVADLHVDLYLPEGPRDPAPVLVWFHAGAFCVGTTKRPQHRALGRRMASAGMALAVPSYRLSTPEDDLSAPVRDALPGLLAMCPPGFRLELAGSWALAALEDSVAALRWLDERRETLGLTGRFVVGGSSAGAINAMNLVHTAPHLGLETPDIGGVLCYSGAYAYPGIYRPGAVPVVALHHPADPKIDIASIRALAARDPKVKLTETSADEHGGFAKTASEPPRKVFGRILGHVREMSGTA